MLDRLVVQVGQYRHNSKTRCGRSPSLYPRVSCVHEEFLRLLDSRVDRERRQRPETRQIEYVEREGKKKRGDKNSHRCNRLEYSTLHGYHTHSSRFGEVRGLQWRRASMISLVRLIPDIPIARTQLYELPCDPRINGHYSPSEIQPRNAIRRGNYSRRNDRPEGLTNITGLRVNLSLPNVCIICNVHMRYISVLPLLPSSIEQHTPCNEHWSLCCLHSCPRVSGPFLWL